MITLAATIAGACERGNPVGPQEGGGVALRLVAPTTIAPGESVQLTANAIRSDGSAEDVSAKTEWTVASATAGSVLSVTATGLVSAGGRGEGVIAARFGGTVGPGGDLRPAQGHAPALREGLGGTASDSRTSRLLRSAVSVKASPSSPPSTVTMRYTASLGPVEVRAAEGMGDLDTLRPRWTRPGTAPIRSRVPTSRPTRDYRGTYNTHHQHRKHRRLLPAALISGAETTGLHRVC